MGGVDSVRTPWAGHQSFIGLTQRGTHTHTHMHGYIQTCRVTSLPSNVCLWMVEGSRSVWRRATRTQGEHAKSAKKEKKNLSVSRFEPRNIFYCKAAVLTTTSPSYPRYETDLTFREDNLSKH